MEQAHSRPQFTVDQVDPNTGAKPKGANMTSHATQALRILRELSKGEVLTTMTATRRLGITTLSQRCGDLKRKGYPIVSRRCRGFPHHAYYIPAAQLALVRRRMRK